ncbi:MAG: TatD family hydrolase [Bacteroidales bacterium]|nr:TatD family hydrolase [Bacteroidales bacterium]
MQLIDSHTHLYLPEFEDDREEVVSRALDNNIAKMLLPNINKDTVEAVLNMADNYPGICYPMIGIHPTSIKEDYRQELDAVTASLKKNNFIAIGEIGIDLYWDSTFVKEQETAFREQLRIAKKEKLPVVIHSRESLEEIITIIDDEGTEGLEGVFHSFTGTIEQAREVINRGFMIGAGGIVTFKNSGLDKIIEAVDIENIILETDSPYLSPVPKRGKRNESSYLLHIAEKLAELKNLPLKEIARITTANSINLFKLQ